MEPENATNECVELNLQASTVLEERFVGCLLAVMAGDILGTPFEGQSRQHLKRLMKSKASFTLDDFAWGKHMGVADCSVLLSFHAYTQVSIIFRLVLGCTPTTQTARWHSPRVWSRKEVGLD